MTSSLVLKTASMVAKSVSFLIMVLSARAPKTICKQSRIKLFPEPVSPTIQLNFEDGSIGTIHYYSNGPKSFPKERLEVFAGGKILQLENYRKLIGYDWPGFKKMNLWNQDKGQKACVKAFVDAIKNGTKSPISIEEILEVSKISIELSK